MTLYKSEISEETNASFYCFNICLKSPKFLYYIVTLAKERGSQQGSCGQREKIKPVSFFVLSTQHSSPNCPTEHQYLPRFFTCHHL